MIDHSRQCAEFMSAIKLADDQESYAQVKRIYPDEAAFLDKGVNYYLPGGIYIPSLDRAVELDFRLRGDRRMAALSLAIRLYELDHGQRPRTLDELVLTYIEGVPLDPFADGSKQIGYKPNAEPPVLYCVGRDGVDDGGAFELRKGGDVHRDKLDSVFFLNGDRPRSKP